jgi:predicted secreted protein
MEGTTGPRTRGVEATKGKQVAKSNTMGSSGETQWTVRARKSGEASFALKHWRQWEGERAVIERFKLTLRILPSQ